MGLSPAFGASYTWTKTAAGNFVWSSTNAWQITGTFPDSPGDAANITSGTSGAQSIELGRNITIGALTIGSASAGSSIVINGTGGSLTFDSGGAGAAQITVQGVSTDTIAASILLNSELVIASTSTNALTISGVVADGTASNGLQINGPGPVILSGANSYSGGTTLNGGTLSVSSDGNLGATSGTLSMGGGTLQTTAGFNSTRAVSLNASSNNISANGGTTLTLAGVVSGTGGLAVTGAGTLLLSNAANSFGGSGATIGLNAGTLSVGADGDLGNGLNTLTFGGGALSATATFASGRNVILTATTANDIAVGPAATLTLNGIVSGAGGITTTGSGTLVLAGANNYAGNTTFNNGDVQVSASQNLGNANNGLAFGGGSLEITNGFSTARNVSLGAGSNTLIIDPSQTLTESGSWSGSGGITVNGGGSLILNGTSSYSGGTTVTGGDELVIGSASSIGSGRLTLATATVATNSTFGLSNAVTLTGSDLIVVAPGTSLTESGTISGTGTLYFTGGQLLLAGNNSYQGGTVINTGTLTVSADSNLGSGGAVTIGQASTLEAAGNFSTTKGIVLGSSNSAIEVDSGDALSQSGVISGTGNLVKIGAGTLTLGGNSTYTGVTLLNGGTLVAGADDNLGATSGALVINSGTFEAGATFGSSRAVSLNAASNSISVVGGSTLTLGGIVSGTGALAVTGSGTLALTNGANSFGGAGSAINLAVGTLSVSSDGALGAAGNTLAFNGGGLSTTASFPTGRNMSLNSASNPIAAGNGTTFTVTGILSGTGNLAAMGSGTLVLAGANAYTGATDFNAGNVLVSSSHNLGSGGAGNILVFNGGSLEVNQGFLTSRNVVLNAGPSTLVVDSGQTLTEAGGWSGSGGITVSGSGTLVLTNASNGFTGGVTISGGHVTIAYYGSLGSGPLALSGGTLTTTTTIVDPNGATLTGSNTLNVAGATSLTINGPLGGSGSLTLAGGGNLTLSGSSSYSGPTNIQNGTVIVSTDSNLGAASGSVMINPTGTLEGTSSFATSRNIAFNGSGGQIVAEPAVTLTLGGVVSGANNFVVGGGGTVVLANASNSFGGASNSIDLNAGTLSVSADGDLGNATNSVVFNGGAFVTTASFSTARAFTLNAPSNVMSIGGGTTLTESGLVTGADGLEVTGGGTLALTNSNNTFGGAGQTIDLNSGILSVASDGAMGNAANSVTIGSASALDATGSFTSGRNIIVQDPMSGINVAGGSTLTLSGSVTGSGGVDVNGGTLVLSGSNSYAGATTIAGGVLQVSSSQNLGSASNTINFGNGTLEATASFSTGRNVSLPSGNGSTVQVDSGATMTESGLWSGPGTATVTGGGTLVLANANNSYGGGTYLNGGSVTIGANGDLGGLNSMVTFNNGTLTSTNSIASSRNWNLSGGATIDVQAGSTFDQFGVISGPGSLTLGGGGELLLDQINTYSGGTTIQSGTLTVGFDQALGKTSGVVTIDGSGVLEANESFAVNHAITLSGSGTIEVDLNDFLTVNSSISGGGLVKTGNGTLMLAANTNSFTGLTTVKAGTLDVLVPGGLGGFGGVTVDSGASLEMMSSIGNDAVTLSGQGVGGLGSSGALYYGGLGGVSLAGNITLAAASTIAVPNGGAFLTLNGIISGTNNLTLQGPGTIILSNAGNTFGGTGDTVTINGATVKVASDGALGNASNSIDINGGLLNTTESFSTSRNLDASGFTLLGVNPGSTLTWSGTVSGGGDIDLTTVGNFTSGGDLVLTASNSYTGSLFIDTGEVTVGNQYALGSTSSSIYLSSGAKLDLGGFAVGKYPLYIEGGELLNSNSSMTTGSFAGPVTMSNNGLLESDGVGGLILSGSLVMDSGFTVAGAYSTSLTGAISGTGEIIKNGTGLLDLSASNSFAGGVEINQGTVKLGNVYALGGTNTETVLSGGVLDFAGQLTSERVVLESPYPYAGDLLNSGTAPGGTSGSVWVYSPVTFSATAGELELTGSIDNVAGIRLTGTGEFSLGVGGLSGAGPLNKVGTGVLLLGGTGSVSNYTGAVTVNAGTVTVESNNAFGATSGVTVEPSATVDMNGYSTSQPLILAGGNNHLAGGILNNSGTAEGIVYGAITAEGPSINQPTLMSTSTSGLLIYGAITLQSNLNIGGANTVDIEGSVNGVSALTKVGTGTLILGGNNAFLGGVMVNKGVVDVTSPNGLGLVAGRTTVLSGATLDLLNNINANPLTLNGAGVSGSGALLNDGGGSLTFGGLITLAGNTDVGVGGAGALDLTGDISGHYSLTKVGTGTLELGANELYTGATIINAGTLYLTGVPDTLPLSIGVTAAGGINATISGLQVNNGQLEMYGYGPQAVGAISQASPNISGTIYGNGAGGYANLVSDSATSSAFGGSMQQYMNFVKEGSSTLTLTATSTLLGTVSVEGGTLSLSGNGALSGLNNLVVSGGTMLLDDSAGAINANRVSSSISLDGGTLLYNGAVSTSSTENIGTVTIQPGANVIGVSGTAGADLTINSLNRGTNTGTVNFTGATLGGTNARSQKIFLNNGNSTSDGMLGGWAVVNGADWASYGANGVGAMGSPGYAAYSTDGLGSATSTDNINMITGTTGINTTTINSLRFAGTSGVDNLTMKSGTSVLTLTSGGLLVTGPGTLVVSNGNLTSGGSELFMDVNAGQLFERGNVVNGNSAVTLEKTGAGTAYLTGSDTYSGGTIVDQGTLYLDTAPGALAIPAGGLTIGPGATVTMLSYSGQIASSNQVTIDGGGNLNLTGNNTIAGLTLAGTGGLAAARINIAGGGELAVTGELITAHNDNYSAAPEVYQGTLDLGGGAFTMSTSGLAPVGLVVTSNLIHGSLIVEGSGAVALNSAQSTFAGGVTLVSGGLVIGASSNGSGASVASGPLGTGTLTIEGNTDIESTIYPHTVGNPVAVDSSFTFAGSSVANDLTLSGSVALNTAATLTVDPFVVATLSGPVSGSQGLTLAGNGTLVLSNSANAFTGPATIESGTLQAGGANVIPSSDQLYIYQNGVFNLNGHSQNIGSLAGGGVVTNALGATSSNLTLGADNTSDTFSGILLTAPKATINLIKVGTGTLALTGPNTFAGSDTVNGGVLQVFADDNLGSLTNSVVLGGGTLNTTQTFAMSNPMVLNGGSNGLEVNSDTVLTETGVISGTGGWTINGPGALILTASNTYSGVTTLANGTVQTSIDAGLGTGPLDFAGGTFIAAGSFTSRRAVNVNGGTGYFNIETGYTVNESGTLSGSQGLSKTGGGTLELSGDNTYTGSTTIGAGTILAASATALGSTNSATTVDYGASLDLRAALGAYAITLSGPGVNNSGALLNSGTGAASLAGPVTMDSHSSIGVTNSQATLTLSGNIGDNGTQWTLTKVGAGTLVMTGSNTYTGPTSINSGAVEVTSSNGLGNYYADNNPVYVTDQGTLDVRTNLEPYTIYVEYNGATPSLYGSVITGGTGAASINGSVQLPNGGGLIFGVPNATASLTLTGGVSGGGNIMKTGSGTLVLTNSGDSVSGNYTIFGGTLSAGSAAPLNGGNPGLVFQGGGFQATGSFALSNSVTLTGGAATPFDPVAGVSLTLNGPVSGNNGLTVTGPGELILGNASNSYSGGTTLQSGTLTISSGGDLGNSSGIFMNGGTLHATTAPIMSASQPITTSSGANNFVIDPSTLLSLSGNITGPGSINMTGDGTLVLDGSNSYTGGTVINSGVNGTGTLAATFDVNLGAPAGSVTIGNATFAAYGSFSSARHIILTSSNSSIAPLGGTTLTLTGSLTGTGELSVTDAGTLVLTNTSNNFGTNGGLINLEAGVLSVASDKMLGNAGNALNFEGGAFLATSSFTSNRAIYLANVSNIAVSASSTLTLTGQISPGAGSGDFMFNGPGTLVLTNPNNAFPNGIDLNGGTLAVGNSGALENGDPYLNFFGGSLSTTSSAGYLQISNVVALYSSTNTITATGTNVLELDGAIQDFSTGGASIVANGSGTLALYGANNYSGNTYLDAGTVQINNSQSLGTSTVVFAGGALEATASFADNHSMVLNGGSNSLIVDAGQVFEEDGLVSGTAGTLVVTGSGTLDLTNGANSYAGTVAGQGVTLGFESGALGSGPITLNNATLAQDPGAPIAMSNRVMLGGTQDAVFAQDGLVESGQISGTAGLLLTGVGTLTLSASNSYSGGTEIQNGDLIVSTNSNLGAASGGVTIDNAGTLEATASFSTARNIALTGPGSTIQADSGVTLTQTGVISGAGSLTQSGPGTLVLGGTNTYAGATTISAGVIQVTSANGLGNTTGVTVDAGASLDLRAAIGNYPVSISQNLSVAALINGGNGAASLGGPVTLNTGASIVVTGSSGSLALTGVISGNHDLSFGGNGTIVLSNPNNSFGAGDVTVLGGILSVNSDGALGNSNNQVYLSGGALLTTASFTSARDLNLNGPADTVIVSASTTLTLTGTLGGESLVLNGPGTLDLTGESFGSYTGPTSLEAGLLRMAGLSHSGFSGSFVFAGGALEDTAGGSAPESFVFNGGSNTLMVDSGVTELPSASWSGTGGITITGGGTVDFANTTGNNSYSGGTTISGSTVVLLAYNGSLGTGPITLSNSTLGTDGVTTPMSLSNGVTLTGSNQIDVQDGTSQLTLSGVVGGTGSLVLDGGARLVLTASNSYSGGTDINNGTLTVSKDSNLGNASGGLQIDENGVLEVTSGFSTARGIVLTGSQSTIQVDSGVTLTQTGVMSGTGGLLKTGTGQLTLNGANTYSGPTTVATGLVVDSSAGGFGNTSGITLDNGAAIDLLASVGNVPLTVSGTGLNSNGALYGGGNTSVTYGGPVTLAGNTTMSAASSLTLSGLLSGTYNLTVAGSGTLALTNASNSFGGNSNTINLNSGTLSAASDGALGDPTNTLNFNGGGLITGAGFNSSRNIALNATTNSIAISGATTLGGVLSGTGTLNLSGTGTVTLAGVNTYQGATNVNGVTVSVSADDNLGTGTALNLTNATLDATATFSTSRNSVLTGSDAIAAGSAVTFTEAGVLSGSGSLTAAGSGLVDLTRTNTYSGGTVITGGTVGISSDSNLGAASGAVTMNGGALQLQSAVSTSRTFNIAGSGGTIDTTAASGTFNGNLTGAGALTEIGGNSLTLGGTGTATGGIHVTGSQLTVNGAYASDPVSLASSANLSGHGSVGAITAGAGAGSISPSLSPTTGNILTAASVDAGNGLTFNFQLNQTGTNPVFTNAANSGNDLLRLTANAPFTFGGALNAGNVINIYLGSGSDSSIFEGGFFTDKLNATVLAADLANATINYFVISNTGVDLYDGSLYAPVPNGDVGLTTGTDTAVFASGTDTGVISIFTVASNAPQPLLSVHSEEAMTIHAVPEPGTYGLVIGGMLLALYGVRRKKATGRN